MPNTHGITNVTVYNAASSPPVAVNIPSMIDEGQAWNLLQTDEAGPLNPNGGRYFAGHTSRAEFNALFSGMSETAGASGAAAYAVLDAYNRADTEMRLAAAGGSYIIGWYNDDVVSVAPVTIEGGVKGRADGFRFQMVRDGGGAHDIYRAINFAGPLGPSPFVDVGANGIADGWVESGSGAGGTTPTFVSGVQTLTTSGLTGSETTLLSRTLVLPLPGTTFTFSAEFTAQHASAVDRLMLRFLNVNGSTISTTYGASNPGTGSAGRAAGAVSVVAPAGTYSVVYGVEIDTITGNGASSFKEPALRVDGSALYTAL